MSKRDLITGWIFGFGIGFFIAITVMTALQTEISLDTSTYRECHRSEFVMQVLDTRTFATIFMSC